jgi:hypothetical protein
VTLGCTVHRKVAAAVRTAMTQVILVVMAPLVVIVGAVSSPLVRSYGDVGVANVQKPDAEEPIRRVPCVEEPSYSR